MFPTHVRIGSHYFEIQFVSKEVLGENDGTLGFRDFCLELYEDLPPAMMIETLLHECLHGALEKIELEEDDEEFLVETLSRAIVAGILDNPVLARLIVNILLAEKKKCEKPVDKPRSRA